MRLLLVGVLLGLGACGSGGGEPLLSGLVQGSYDGDPFTVQFGFAVVHDGANLIGLSDSGVDCGSHSANDPPRGNTGVFTVPELAVGNDGTVLVQLFHNVGDFEGVGANTGSVSITSVTADSVSGTIAWSYTDDDGRMFSLSGTFEVLRCPD